MPKNAEPPTITRQDRLRAWLALNRIKLSSLARELGVHPSMVTRIIKGDRAPARRIAQLIHFGLPADLLPHPSGPPGRPPKRKAMKPTGE